VGDPSFTERVRLPSRLSLPRVSWLSVSESCVGTSIADNVIDPFSVWPVLRVTHWLKVMVTLRPDQAKLTQLEPSTPAGPEIPSCTSARTAPSVAEPCSICACGASGAVSATTPLTPCAVVTANCCCVAGLLGSEPHPTRVSPTRKHL